MAPRPRPARTAARAATVAILLALSAGACSSGGHSSTKGVDPNAAEVNEPGDIPDDQVFVTYTAPSGEFSLKVPEGWSRTESGGSILFSDKLNSIRIETTSAPTAPTVASVRSKELASIADATAGYEPRAVKAVTRTSGPAVLITYRADSDPDPVTARRRRLDVERYELWHAGTEVILTLSGAQGADNVDPWRIVTDSFAFRR